MSATSKRETGVLLVNLGTPQGEPGVGPSDEQVRDYLEEFLMDPHVIDIPYVLRWILIHGWILRKRPGQSAEAYREVWTDRGSPLLVHHLDLAEKVRGAIGDAAVVEAAMRYGSPSIPDALARLKSRGVKDLLIIPLYPQYSMSATRSSVRKCETWIRGNAPSWRVRIFPPFYASSLFISAFAAVVRESLAGYEYDHLLFSFHGLPERHMHRVDEDRTHCMKGADCCREVVAANRDCYRAQCFATAKALAQELGLDERRYTVCFQSRLGRTPWIKPYTDFMYQELAEKGVKRIAVICPSFVADCLETLEEIGIRGRADFLSRGGSELKLVPSLNASKPWVSALSQMIRENL